MGISKGFLVGKKTYIVAAAILLHGLLGWGLGTAELGQVMLEVLNALGLAALRAGVSNG